MANTGLLGVEIEVDGSIHEYGRKVVVAGHTFSVHENYASYLDVYDENGPDLDCWRLIAHGFEDMLDQILESLCERDTEIDALVMAARA